ncbi:hypothetical protein BaRGS_00011463 [Batillaria attramentaria]|uniref:Uncharacterized protein n=1 Tax=Batillaria attramentaria TaxID=370345 RepID=A0ABD0LDT8_9CAEN
MANTSPALDSTVRRLVNTVLDEGEKLRDAGALPQCVSAAQGFRGWWQAAPQCNKQWSARRPALYSIYSVTCPRRLPPAPVLVGLLVWLPVLRSTTGRGDAVLSGRAPSVVRQVTGILSSSFSLCGPPVSGSLPSSSCLLPCCTVTSLTASGTLWTILHSYSLPFSV